MYELRNLWFSVVRPLTVATFVLLLAMAPVSPVLAQASAHSPAAGTSVDTGVVVTQTDGDGDNDGDEWENDILKGTAAPVPSDSFLEMLQALFRAFGLGSVVSPHHTGSR